MEEEPDSRFDPSDQNDDFEDYIEVPENVKVPESSSSPEIIGLEEDQDSAPVPKDMDNLDIAGPEKVGKASETRLNRSHMLLYYH